MPLQTADFTPYTDEDGKISVSNRLQAALDFGSDWYENVTLHQNLVEKMKPVLTDRFLAVSYFTIPDIEIQIPLLLFCPDGARVVSVNTISGIFEARGDEWLELNTRKQEYQPASPNIIEEAHRHSKAVGDFLASKKINLPMLQPVIYFSNSGVDIETIEPSVRVVRVDGLRRWLSSLEPEESGLSSLEITSIRQVFERTARAREKALNQKPVREPLKNPLARFNFSTTQWIILGLILAVNIIFILVLAALFFSGT